ncbi:MAG: DUF4292 domain-containing protein [Bacteroidota bacterium]
MSGISWNFMDKNRLDIHEMDFEYFSGKAKINYKDDELDIKAKANVRIKKDSLIWINFSAIGIQGARCLISKDSITIVNTLKKEYYVFNYDSLSEQFNFDVNFEVIQSVALGNLVVNRNKTDVVEKQEDQYLLKQRSGNVAVNNYVNAKTMKIERVEMLEVPSKNSAVIRYYDFEMIEDEAFPYSAILSLFYKEAGKGTLNTVIKFEYSKAVIEDKVLKFPFNIAKKYERR